MTKELAGNMAKILANSGAKHKKKVSSFRFPVSRKNPPQRHRDTEFKQGHLSPTVLSVKNADEDKSPG
jgi:hypothetical protein